MNIEASSALPEIDLEKLKDFEAQLKSLGSIMSSSSAPSTSSTSPSSSSTSSNSAAIPNVSTVSNEGFKISTEKEKPGNVWSATAEKVWNTADHVLPGFETYSHIEMAKKIYNHEKDDERRAYLEKKVSPFHKFIRNLSLYQNKLTHVVEPVDTLLLENKKFFHASIEQKLNLFTPAKLEHFGKVGMLSGAILTTVPTLALVAIFPEDYLSILAVGTVLFLSVMALFYIILKGYGFKTAHEPFEKVREEIVRLLHMFEARDNALPQHHKKHQKLLASYKKEIEKTDLEPNIKNWGLLYNSLKDLKFLFKHYNLNSRVVVIRVSPKPRDENNPPPPPSYFGAF